MPQAIARIGPLASAIALDATSVLAAPITAVSWRVFASLHGTASHDRLVARLRGSIALAS